MFKQHTNVVNEPFVLVPTVANEVYKVGEALVLNATGKATKASGAVKPLYICQEGATGADGKEIHCTVVGERQKLEVPLSALGTALKAGNKVTIGADGLTVTATTADGTFTITEILGTAIGNKVRGYFGK